MILRSLILSALLCAWSCAALGQTQPVQGIGTAGSPAGGVLTVQPPAGGTAPDTKVDQGAAAAITGGWPVTDGAGTDTTGTLTSGAGSVIAQIDGYSSAKIQIKGTYAAFTASVLVSSDGGTTTVPLQCAMIDGSQFGSSFNLAANQSAEISCGHQSGDDTLILSTSAGPASGTANVDISPASFPSIDGSTVKAITGALNVTGGYASAIIGTGDSTPVAAGVAKSFLDLVNLSPTATVCINFGSAATITGTACAAGEIALPPLWHRSWEANFVPADAIHAIASAASVPFTIGAK